MKRSIRDCTFKAGASKSPSKRAKDQDKEDGSEFQSFLDDIHESRFKCASSIEHFNFNNKRVRLINNIKKPVEQFSSVIYWMSRDQRVEDNWSMLFAQKLALQHKCPLHVCFCLVPKFLDATIRHYDFLLKGLQHVEEQCEKRSVHFDVLLGSASEVLPKHVKMFDAGTVVTDFSPLRIPLKWVSDVGDQLKNIGVPLYQVDSHNIVPCWETSNKLEYAARTIRSKIHNKLDEYLTEFPPVIKHPYQSREKFDPINWQNAYDSLQVDMSVEPIEWAIPGSSGGLRELFRFINYRLKQFVNERNDPTKNCLSNLSPWFHFGQLSIQRAILEVKKYRNKYKESVDTFIEETLVRRELSDNFCFYNPDYDTLAGAPEWARKTLKDHAKDKRDYIYSETDFEKGKTHDKLWNAAQNQMVLEGKMHGYLRMYWAKKILEWTEKPEDALRIAIWLNDKYELDGRDPNGFVGCLWSIGGVHDQGWRERAVFGKVRYMNYEGCKRKFDVDQLISMYPNQNPKKQ